MNWNLLRMLPLFLLLVFAAVISSGIFNDSVPQTDTVGTRLPTFSVPLVNNAKVRMTPANFTGQVVVLNIFASWCRPCLAEHGQLMEIAQSRKVNVYGIAWRDKDANVVKYLNEHGNPFQLVGYDPHGDITLPFSLSGVPETILIDRDGTIRYHHISSLSSSDVDEMLDIVDRLNAAHVAAR